eukprot:4473306-Pleurochrysis_carterae.AAC.3
MWTSCRLLRVSIGRGVLVHLAARRRGVARGERADWAGDEAVAHGREDGRDERRRRGDGRVQRADRLRVNAAVAYRREERRHVRRRRAGQGQWAHRARELRLVMRQSRKDRRTSGLGCRHAGGVCRGAAFRRSVAFSQLIRQVVQVATVVGAFKFA